MGEKLDIIRKSLDFQTPREVCKYMVSLIPEDVKTVLEPTPGQGNIVSFLSGYHVIAPEDFFLLKEQRFDAVIMNPPFSAKYAFLDNAEPEFMKSGIRLGYGILKRCMRMSDNIIALMPWFTISDSDVRLRNLKNFGLVSITALPRKTFQFARIQTCIFQLQKGYQGETKFIVYDLINKPEKVTGDLFQ